MRLLEYLRARNSIKNWQDFYAQRKVMLPPEEQIRTKIELRNGLVINTRVGTADLTAVMGLFLKNYYKGIKDSYDVVVDIGAHIGCFSIFAAGRARRVFALEPVPDNFELLKANLRENRLDNVTAHCAAIAETDGETTLYYHDTHSDSHSTRAPDPGSHFLRRLSVPTLSIASLMARHDIDRIDMIKMDCEGAEYDVLFALDPDVAARIGEIFLEYHASSDPDRNYTTLDAHLTNLGFHRDWLRRGKQHGYAHYLRF